MPTMKTTIQTSRGPVRFHSVGEPITCIPAAHTPGPWIADSRSNEIHAKVDPENSETYLAPVAYTDGDWTPAIQHANARLIASAPELLAELAALVAEADENGGSVRTVSRYRVDQARAAIAKAKGVQL